MILVQEGKEKRDAVMVVSGWGWKSCEEAKKRSRRLDNHSFSGLSGLEAPKWERVWNGCKPGKPE